MGSSMIANKVAKSKKYILGIEVIVLFLIIGILAYLVTAKYCPKTINVSGYSYYQYGICKEGALDTECFYYNFLLRTPKAIMDDYVRCGNSICAESPLAYSLRGGAGNIDYAAGYIDLANDYNEAYDMHILRGCSQFSQDETMLHELGHFVDCQLGLISSSDEWVHITEEESAKSIYGMVENYDGSGYYYRTPKEFWAQEFCCYLNCIHGDKESGVDEGHRCSKAYKFIENAIKAYYGEDVLSEMSVSIY